MGFCFENWPWREASSFKTWRIGVVFRIHVHSYGPSFQGGFFWVNWAKSSHPLALMAGFANAGFGEDWDASCFWLGAATIWGWGNLEREIQNVGKMQVQHESQMKPCETIGWPRCKLFSNQPAHIWLWEWINVMYYLVSWNCWDSHFLVWIQIATVKQPTYCWWFRNPKAKHLGRR